MVGVADQAARGVSVLGEQPQEAPGDLPVASGDEDVHPPRLEERRTYAQRRGHGASGREAARTAGVSDPVSVLDVDTALADLIPSDQRAQARQATGAATIEFDVGSWTAPVDSDAFRGGYGLLVFEGLMLRRAGIEGRHAAELLGPGDLLRPWQHDGGDSTLEVDWAFRIVAPARVAVLDPRWTARAAAWPQLGAELAGRALMRSLRLVIAMAIAQQPRLDERLWMLFWDLADRFGKVHGDGVHLDLPLTHEVLSHLAGARRPSVSGALTRLADEGRLRRSGRHWVLAGDPPAVDQRLSRAGAR